MLKCKMYIHLTFFIISPFLLKRNCKFSKSKIPWKPAVIARSQKNCCWNSFEVSLHRIEFADSRVQSVSASTFYQWTVWRLLRIFNWVNYKLQIVNPILLEKNESNPNLNQIYLNVYICRKSKVNVQKLWVRHGVR